MASSSPSRGDLSSPTRQLQREERQEERKLRRQSSHHSPRQSPYRGVNDSPSRQLYEEFSRLFVEEDRAFRIRLDEHAAEQERLHKLALAQSAAEHERVRQNAERARERVELEIERERKRREEEERHALEAERKAKAERESAERRRALEEVQKRQEEERRRAEEEKALQDAKTKLEDQRRRNEEEDARRKKEQEEARREALEEEAAAAKAKAQAEAEASKPSPAPVTNGTAVKQAAPPSIPQAVASTPAASTAPPSNLPKSDSEALHQRYLDLHKRLKEMRNFVLTEGKKLPSLKTQLGDWRRQINKSMGMLTTDKTKNRKPIRDITDILTAASRMSELTIDVSPYIISYPIPPGTSVQAPGVLLYLMNIFAKAVVRQCISEGWVSAKAADPIGVIGISVFAQRPFKLEGTIPLIDILLAKFHFTCPVLFGVYGNEKTPSGRARIGWGREDGEWVSPQAHLQRQTGLAAGYAALTLRDFSKSKNDNPYPPRHYWTALAKITNVPSEQIQPTHFVVLKGLVDGNVERFVNFYGQAAIAALKRALVDFPSTAPDSSAKLAIQTLPEVFKKDMRVTLA